MNKFAHHYLSTLLSKQARSPFFGPLVQTLAGATAGAAVNVGQQAAVNQTLDYAGRNPVGGMPAQASLLSNIMVGALAGTRGGRRMLSRNSPASAIAGLQLAQFGVMGGDRVPLIIDNLTNASGAPLIDGVTELADKMKIIGQKGDRVMSVMDKHVTPERLVAMDKTVNNVLNSTATLSDTVNRAIEGGHETARQLKESLSTEDGKKTMSALVRAVDPKWMIGTAAAIGIPMLAYELFKKRQARDKILKEKQKEERMLTSVESIAKSMNKQRHPLPYAALPG